MRIDTPKIIVEYPYRPNWVKTMFITALSATGSVWLTYLALTIDHPLQAKGIPLTAAQGRIFFACFAALSLLGTIALVGITYVAMFGDCRVAVTPESLVLPRPSWHGYSSDEIEIPWSTIHDVSIISFIGSTVLMRFELTEGVIHVPSNMFSHRRQFDELTLLVQRMVSGVNESSISPE